MAIPFGKSDRHRRSRLALKMTGLGRDGAARMTACNVATYADFRANWSPWLRRNRRPFWMQQIRSISFKIS
jgi:hypothetical protein